VKKIKKSKIKLIKKSFTGELYDSSLILSKIPIICKEWITKEKLCNFNSMLEVLEKQLTLEQLRLVYRNIATVKVKKLTPIDSLSVCGYYDTLKREISYDDDQTLSHEFLHMASSIYSNKSDVSFSGLSQWDCKGKFGIGLNEGYTELLNNRLFHKDVPTDIYIEERNIARAFELFFNNEKEMMNYYFGCDLPGFINYFEKFMPREEFIKLLIEIDKLSYLLCKGFPFVDNKLVTIYQKIYEAFIKSNPSIEKLKIMESIIFEDAYIYDKFQIKEKRLVKKKK